MVELFQELVSKKQLCKCEDCKGEFDKCFECMICENNFINKSSFQCLKYKSYSNVLYVREH